MSRDRHPRFRNATFGTERVYRFSTEELKRGMADLDPAMMAYVRSRMRAHEDRMMEDLLRAAASPSGSPFGAPPYARPVEVITDPLDTRGLNARRVGP